MSARAAQVSAIAMSDDAAEECWAGSLAFIGVAADAYGKVAPK